MYDNPTQFAKWLIDTNRKYILILVLQSMDIETQKSNIILDYMKVAEEFGNLEFLGKAQKVLKERGLC